MSSEFPAGCLDYVFQYLASIKKCDPISIQHLSDMLLVSATKMLFISCFYSRRLDTIEIESSTDLKALQIAMKVLTSIHSGMEFDYGWFVNFMVLCLSSSHHAITEAAYSALKDTMNSENCLLYASIVIETIASDENELNATLIDRIVSLLTIITANTSDCETSYLLSNLLNSGKIFVLLRCVLESKQVSGVIEMKVRTQFPEELCKALSILNLCA